MQYSGSLQQDSDDGCRGVEAWDSPDDDEQDDVKVPSEETQAESSARGAFEKFSMANGAADTLRRIRTETLPSKDKPQIWETANVEQGGPTQGHSIDINLEQQAKDEPQRWETANVEQGGSTQGHSIDINLEQQAQDEPEGWEKVNAEQGGSAQGRNIDINLEQQPQHEPERWETANVEQDGSTQGHSIDINLEILDGVKKADLSIMSCNKELSMVEDEAAGANENLIGTSNVNCPFRYLRVVDGQACEQVTNEAGKRKAEDIDDQIIKQNRQAQNPDELIPVKDRSTMLQDREVEAAAFWKRQMEASSSEQNKLAQNPSLCDELPTAKDRDARVQDIDAKIINQNRQVQNPSLSDELHTAKNRDPFVQDRQADAARVCKMPMHNVPASKRKESSSSEHKRQVQNPSVRDKPKDFDDKTCADKTQLENSSFCHDQATSQKTQLNILLLGETGVGKSTMINAFANYITFQNMEEAASLNQDMIALVPMAFTQVDKNYQTHEIKFGEPDPNEHHENKGESVTQSCRSYTFPLSENQIVHLIDTPGIGDTRGVEQDQANFSQIFAYLANYEEIHGICIMLKPNNARLNITFSFCIKELLRHLHKSASANIVFLFTYARGTLYTPGDTVAPLKVLIKEVLDVHPDVTIPFNASTVYCVDNEAVRLVVASKKGFSFSERDRISFSESWSRSTEECKRMLRHFESMKPHKVMETLSLNTATSLVMKLQQPLASVVNIILENSELFEKKKKELKDFEGKPGELKYKVEMEEVQMQANVLEGGSATVCTNVRCCKRVTLKDSMRICHQPCMSAKDAYGREQASWLCRVIDFFGNCKVCSCSLRYHVRVNYVPQFVRRKTSLPIAVADVDAGLKLEAHKKVLEQSSQEWQEELNEISKAAAYFTVFVKNNAFAPNADNMQAYVKNQIAVEESSGIMRAALVKRMQEFLVSYEQEVQEARRNGQEVSAAGVMEMANSLYKQKHTGAKLQELVQMVSTAEQRTVQLSVKTCPRPSRATAFLQRFR